jgi:hypothetical protein
MVFGPEAIRMNFFRRHLLEGRYLCMLTGFPSIGNMSLGEEEKGRTRPTKALSTGCRLIIQNLHLTGKWVMVLKTHLKAVGMTELHLDLRLFYTAEPSTNITGAILRNSIKVISEPAPAEGGA